MARGGINKAHVLQARAALLAKGANPSIDAVRSELGNTGSKSTIHRYLREIEEEQGARLDDQALLSGTLQEMVGRLAAQLREEAQGLIEAASARYEAQRQHWLTEAAEHKRAVETLSTALQGTEALLTEEHARHQDVASRLHHETLQGQRLTQQVADMSERLAENEQHRQSLEEKHRFARESLEHFRQSAKEQREQDQRRHEQQVQQLQAELRQLNQTLIVKQTDITHLNKDNGRLASDVTALQKQLVAAQTGARALEANIASVREHAEGVEGELNHARGVIEAKQAQSIVNQNALFEHSERLRELAIALSKAEAVHEVQVTAIAALRSQLDETRAEATQSS